MLKLSNFYLGFHIELLLDKKINQLFMELARVTALYTPSLSGYTFTIEY